MANVTILEGLESLLDIEKYLYKQGRGDKDCLSTITLERLFISDICLYGHYQLNLDLVYPDISSLCSYIKRLFPMAVHIKRLSITSLQIGIIDTGKAQLDQFFMHASLDDVYRLFVGHSRHSSLVNHLMYFNCYRR